MDGKEFSALIREQRFGDCFLIYGEEEYLKRHYLGEMRRAILTDETFNPFNHVILEGAAPDFDALYSAAEGIPMMADYRLVEWHRMDMNALKEEALTSLLTFAERVRAAEGLCVVFYVNSGDLNTGTKNKPSALFKKLSGAMTVLYCPPSTDAQLVPWLVRHFAHEGIGADAEVCRLLISRTGHNMEVLAKEVDKLICYCKAHAMQTVSAMTVRTVASVNPENDAFGLSNALLNGDAAAAFNCFAELKRNQTDPQMILGILLRFYCDLLQVAMLRKEGMPPTEIARELGMNEYKAKLYCNAAARRSPAALRGLLEQASFVDISLKSGGGGKNAAWYHLDRLVATATRQAP